MRLYNYNERQAVWGTRKYLNNTNFSISENFCSESTTAGKYTPYTRLRNWCMNMSKTVTLLEDTLILKMVFGGVFSEHDTLSKWSPSRICYGNNVYGCLEQAYMHIGNGDARMVKQIGSKIKIKNEQ